VILFSGLKQTQRNAKTTYSTVQPLTTSLTNQDRKEIQCKLCKEAIENERHSARSEYKVVLVFGEKHAALVVRF